MAVVVCVFVMSSQRMAPNKAWLLSLVAQLVKPSDAELVRCNSLAEGHDTIGRAW